MGRYCLFLHIVLDLSYWGALKTEALTKGDSTLKKVWQYQAWLWLPSQNHSTRSKAHFETTIAVVTALHNSSNTTLSYLSLTILVMYSEWPKNSDHVKNAKGCGAENNP